MDDIEQTMPPRRRNRAGKSASISEAMAAISDHDRVYVSPICSVPLALVDGLVQHRDQWSHIDIVTDYLTEPLAPFAHPHEPFELISLQPSRAVETMREAGALRTVPASYSQFAHLLGPNGPFSIDVALVHVSPQGPEGRFSLGVGVGAALELVRTASLVIAQVNPQMPYTFGAGELERDEIDLLVDVDHPLLELVVPHPDELARTIGGFAAGEIGDGSMLQFGIGAVPESILGALEGRSNLGIHGGMIGDTVIDLVESGALNGANNRLHPGKMVVAGVLGTRRSFDWSHRHPDLLTVPSGYSHGAATLSRVENFVAINSALAIGLDGSVNAETAGGRVLSGPGGQPDFALGASASPSGLSIVAMPSTAARGTQSRIVTTLPEGATTTLPRYLVDTVVTEYGVAKLRGLPLEERAAVLQAIAHPDFRAGLR